MTFTSEWEAIYRGGAHLSIWPWSDLISYVKRYCKYLTPSSNVLELGCGAGANIPFFLSLPVNYFAIEGSSSMVNNLLKKFPKLNGRLVNADFTKSIPFDERFDLIIDRASLTHNSTQSILACLELIRQKLKSGSKYIGIDWFSTDHSEYANREAIEIDKYTKTGYKTGQFAGVGSVHFSDKNHLMELFCDFDMEILELKIIYRKVPNDDYKFASWNFVAVKR